MWSKKSTRSRPETNETTLRPRPKRKQMRYTVLHVMDACLRSRFVAGPAALARGRRRRELLDEPLDQDLVLDNRAEEDQAFARLLVFGDLHQGAAQLRVAAELLGGLDEPEVDFVVELPPRFDVQQV